MQIYTRETLCAVETNMKFVLIAGTGGTPGSVPTGEALASERSLGVVWRIVSPVHFGTCRILAICEEMNRLWVSPAL